MYVASCHRSAPLLFRAADFLAALANSRSSLAAVSAASSTRSSSVSAASGGTPPRPPWPPLPPAPTPTPRFPPSRGFASNFPGGTATSNASRITLHFNLLSASVVALSDGDAFTSINHGFKDSSTRRSYPYSSKQCRSLTMTLLTARSECVTQSRIAANNASVAVFPRVDSKCRRRSRSGHLFPCDSLYSSPLFCIATFVRCTNGLSMSATSPLYFTLQNLANPSFEMNARSGRYDVTVTYSLRSNFFPPISSGLWTYRDTMYASCAGGSVLSRSL
eukprot:29786-Pelagococcus_subviridis.AAC.7